MKYGPGGKTRLRARFLIEGSCAGCKTALYFAKGELDMEPRLGRIAGIVTLAAASLGLSRMYSDDLEQLEAGMLLYDAFYRWARDATDETHNWPTNKPKAE